LVNFGKIKLLSLWFVCQIAKYESTRISLSFLWNYIPTKYENNIMMPFLFVWMELRIYSKIAFAFQWLQFVRIFKYQKFYIFLIAQAFIQLLTLHDWQKYEYALYLNRKEHNKLIIRWPAHSQSQWSNFPSHKIITNNL